MTEHQVQNVVLLVRMIPLPGGWHDLTVTSGLTPDESSYSWVDEWQGLGCCIALAKDLSAQEALRRLVTHPVIGIGPVQAARHWAEGQDYQHYGTSVEATTANEWAVTIEVNGFQATRPHALARLSTGTKAVVVYWNVNALMGFHWAVDGTQLRHFDPLLYDNPGWQGQPLPEEEGLAFGLGHPIGAAMACAERLTGIQLTQDFLDDRADWVAVGHHPMGE